MHHVILDCRAPADVARFYSKLLGLPITYESEDWVVVSESSTSSGLAFQLAPDHQPPTWPDPAVNSKSIWTSWWRTSPQPALARPLWARKG